MRSFKRHRAPRFGAAVLWLALASPPTALGELSGDQVALIYNANSAVSRQLALNYARLRGVPDAHLIGLDLPPAEDVSRDDFVARGLEPLRAELLARDLADRVRCLVTFYDLPLRVGAIGPTDEASTLADRLDGQYAAAANELVELCAELNRLGAEPAATATAPADAPAERGDLAELLRYYGRTRSAALERIGQLTPRDGAAVKRQFLRIVEQTEGTVGLIRGLRPAAQEADPRAGRRFAQMKGLSQRMQAQLAGLLDHPPTSAEREEARRSTRPLLGVVGLLTRLDHDQRQLRGEDTLAALDSELSLLWYESYPAYSWITNPDNPRNRLEADFRGPVEAPRPGERPVLMVSRLDGPSPKVVQRLFEHAIAVEKQGLRGNVYVDAAADRTSEGYRTYNENLLHLAALLESKTSLPVVLDTRAELFGPGDCPAAALYCGWYSHRRYVPAFEFLSGSVGYHIASSEAVSLRDPARQYWCKRMLEEGIAATIGPVREPYLAAFPLPVDFFGLLLTGRYSLVECYHLSTPYLSWMMVLIGDPLYRPFAADPQLTPADVYPHELLPFLPPAEPRAIDD